jgi:hypothetical protein
VLTVAAGVAAVAADVAAVDDVAALDDVDEVSVVAAVDWVVVGTVVAAVAADAVDADANDAVVWVAVVAANSPVSPPMLATLTTPVTIRARLAGWARFRRVGALGPRDVLVGLVGSITAALGGRPGLVVVVAMDRSMRSAPPHTLSTPLDLAWDWRADIPRTALGRWRDVDGLGGRGGAAPLGRGRVER